MDADGCRCSVSRCSSVRRQYAVWTLASVAVAPFVLGVLAAPCMAAANLWDVPSVPPPVDHTRYAAAITNCQTGSFAAALQIIEREMSQRLEAAALAHWSELLASVFAALNQEAPARTHFSSACAKLRNAYGVSSPFVASCVSRHAYYLEALGLRDEAARVRSGHVMHLAMDQAPDKRRDAFNNQVEQLKQVASDYVSTPGTRRGTLIQAKQLAASYRIENQPDLVELAEFTLLCMTTLRTKGATTLTGMKPEVVVGGPLDDQRLAIWQAMVDSLPPDDNNLVLRQESNGSHPAADAGVSLGSLLDVFYSMPQWALVSSIVVAVSLVVSTSYLLTQRKMKRGHGRSWIANAARAHVRPSSEICEPHAAPVVSAPAAQPAPPIASSATAATHGVTAHKQPAPSPAAPAAPAASKPVAAKPTKPVKAKVPVLPGPSSKPAVRHEIVIVATDAAETAALKQRNVPGSKDAGRASNSPPGKSPAATKLKVAASPPSMSPKAARSPPKAVLAVVASASEDAAAAAAAGHMPSSSPAQPVGSKPPRAAGPTSATNSAQPSAQSSVTSEGSGSDAGSTDSTSISTTPSPPTTVQAVPPAKPPLPPAPVSASTAQSSMDSRRSLAAPKARRWRTHPSELPPLPESTPVSHSAAAPSTPARVHVPQQQQQPQQSALQAPSQWFMHLNSHYYLGVGKYGYGLYLSPVGLAGISVPQPPPVDKAPLPVAAVSPSSIPPTSFGPSHYDGASVDPVRAQLASYFSDANLARDEYLRQRMDAAGYVFLTVVANFSTIRAITSNLQVVFEAAAGSNAVELQNPSAVPTQAKIRVRRGWDRWVKK